MAKQRVLIIGGGMSALTTAYQLSRTAELRERYAITIYQTGWKLGGKLASGRRRPNLRNIEHGLHVWFGFYENAFALLRDWTARYRYATVSTEEFTDLAGHYRDAGLRSFWDAWLYRKPLPELPSART